MLDAKGDHGRSAAGTCGLNTGHRQRRAGRGFTLVELLVVVSIIALLVSILLPSLSMAREQAKLVKCLSHARGMAQAGLVFSQDHAGKFQISTNNVGLDKADPTRRKFEYGSHGELLAWPVALAQSANVGLQENWLWGIREVLFEEGAPVTVWGRKSKIHEEFKLATCPGDRVGISTPWYPYGDQPGMLAGPGDPHDTDAPDPGPTIGYWGALSFGINEDLVGAEVVAGSNYGAVGRYWRDPAGNPRWAQGEMSPYAGQRFQGNLDLVHDPSSILLLVDAGPNDVDGFVAGAYDPTLNSAYANLITSAKCPGPWLEDFVGYWSNRIPSRRHVGGRVNVLFADYHGETVAPVSFRDSAYVTQKVPTKYNAKVRISPYRPTPD